MDSAKDTNDRLKRLKTRDGGVLLKVFAPVWSLIVGIRTDYTLADDGSWHEERIILLGYEMVRIRLIGVWIARLRNEFSNLARSFVRVKRRLYRMGRQLRLKLRIARYTLNKVSLNHSS